MSDWFTVEEIDASTFVISEYGHWEETHCYLFIGSQQAVLLDTGTGISPIKPIVEKLTNKPVLVVTSHCHWDHIGGHADFERIAVHAADRDWLENGLPLPLDDIRANVCRAPFTRTAPVGFDIEKYHPYTGVPTLILTDGMTLDLGQRSLHVLHTPGHSPGHVCLLERETGYLAVGDLLYRGTVYVNYPSTDPAAYEASIARLARLEGLTRILPGHNALPVPVQWLMDLNQALQAATVQHGAASVSIAEVTVLF